MLNTRIAGLGVIYSTDILQLMDSAIQITSPQTDVMGIVNVHGLESGYMGTSKNSKECPYCLQTNRHICGGHLGIIKNIPLYLHPSMLTMAISIFNITCMNCGNLVISADAKSKLMNMPCHTIQDLYKIINKKHPTKSSNCAKCKYPVQNYHRADQMLASVMIGDKKNQTTVLSDILEKYNSILKESSEWNKMFGDHFKLFVSQLFCSTLLVVPYPHRPYAMNILNNSKQTPFISFLYQQIIVGKNDYNALTTMTTAEKQTINIGIFSNIMMLMFGDSTPPRIDNRNILENNDSLAPVTKKSGFIRQNLLPKTFKMCGRGMALCNASLRPGVIRIGQIIAKQFTIKSHVHAFNIEYLSSLERGGENWPRIIKLERDGVVYTPIDQLFYDLDLRVGDYIHRDCLDGDIMLIHRAPTLKNTNFHTVRVMVGRTDEQTDSGIEINPTELSQMLGGDVDGDVLTGVIVDSEEAEADMIILTSVEQNIKSFKNGDCYVSMTNNGVLGLMIATIYKFDVDKSDILRMLDQTHITAKRQKDMIEDLPKEKNTLVDYVNMFIPEYINIHNKTIYKKLNKDEPDFNITNGKITSGIFCTNTSTGNPKTGIGEYLITTINAASAIDTIHDMRMCAETILQFTGFGYTPLDGKLTDETMMIIYTSESVRRMIISSILDVLAFTPHSTSGTSIDLRFSRIIEIMDPFVYLQTIIKSLKGGRLNQIQNLIMSVRKGVDDLVQLSGLGGSAIVKQSLPDSLKNDRIHAIHHGLSINPCDLGYMKRGPAIGMNAEDIHFQGEVGNSALVERRYGAQEPGTLSRIDKNNMSHIRGNAYCQMVTHSLINNPFVISSTAGLVNGHPSKLGLISVNEWVMFVPESNEGLFMTSSGLSTLYDLFKKHYDELVNIFNNTSDLPESSNYIMHMEVLYTPFKNMSKISRTKSPNEYCHKMYKHFIDLLPYIMFGQKARSTGFIPPAYAYDIVRLLTVSILIKWPVSEVIYYEMEEWNIFLNDLYYKIVDALLNPWTPVGCRAATDMTEELTQKTLDAPKTAKGIAVELQQYKSRITTHAGKDKYSNAFCEIKKVLPSYQRFVYKTLDYLDPHFTIHKKLPKEYDNMGYYDFRPGTTQGMFYIICTIRRFYINAADLNLDIVLLRLSMGFDGLIILLTADEDRIKILLRCLPINRNDYTSLFKYLNRTIKKLPIGGIVGISEIEISTYTGLSIVKGEIIETSKSLLRVKTNSLKAVLQIPDTDYDNIIFENPAMQEKYYGIVSAHTTMLHFIQTMFPSQYITNSKIYADVATSRGYFIPINKYILDKTVPENVLQNAVVGKAKDKFKMAPFITEYIPTDDLVSAMMLGSEAPMGSAAATIIEEIVEYPLHIPLT